MSKYRIYAGLKGRFGGMVYQGTYEFASQEEATWHAYDTAWDEYESHGGKHGLPDRDAAYDGLLEAGWIDPGHQSDEEIKRMADDCYREHIESWIEYKAVLIPEGERDNG